MVESDDLTPSVEPATIKMKTLEITKKLSAAASELKIANKRMIDVRRRGWMLGNPIEMESAAAEVLRLTERVDVLTELLSGARNSGKEPDNA